METPPALFAGHPVFLVALPSPPATSLSAALVAVPVSAGAGLALEWRRAASVAAVPEAELALAIRPARWRAERRRRAVGAEALTAGVAVELRSVRSDAPVSVPAAGRPVRVFRLAAADADSEARSGLASLLPTPPPPPALALGRGLRLEAVDGAGAALSWPAGGGGATVQTGGERTVLLAVPAVKGAGAADFNPFAALLTWVLAEPGEPGCTPAGRDARAARFQVRPAAPGVSAGHPSAVAAFSAWYAGCVAASRAAFGGDPACPALVPPPATDALGAAIFDACHWRPEEMRHGCGDGPACEAAKAAAGAGRSPPIPGALDIDAALEEERLAADGGPVSGSGAGGRLVAVRTGATRSLAAQASDALWRLLTAATG